MGLGQFHVQFSNNYGVYFSGQVIQGQVVVEVLNEPKKTRGIHLTFKGKGEVHWTEKHTTGSGENRRTETRHYRNEETYFENRIYVFGSGSEIYIQPGYHVFPFSFQLPSQIPSSYESHHGQVRYYVKACIDRPWRFDHECKGFFTVNSILDLNMEANAAMPSETSNSKNFCCLCCKSGPLSSRISIPKIGYVPGERLIFNALVDNKSNKKMSSTIVRFKQQTTYTAYGGKQKHDEKTIQEFRQGEIEPGDDYAWNNVALTVPPMPPSELRFCTFIHIQYWLEFRVDPSGVGMDLVLKLPIIIGSIPLRSVFDQFAPAAPVIPVQPPMQPSMPGQPPMQPGMPGQPPMQPGMPWQPGMPGQPPMQPDPNVYPPYPSKEGMDYNPNAPPLPMSEYPDLPPPSYEQSVWGVDNNRLRHPNDNEHVGGNWDFVPRYPSYNFNG